MGGVWNGLDGRGRGISDAWRCGGIDGGGVEGVGGSGSCGILNEPFNGTAPGVAVAGFMPGRIGGLSVFGFSARGLVGLATAGLTGAGLLASLASL